MVFMYDNNNFKIIIPNKFYNGLDILVLNKYISNLNSIVPIALSSCKSDGVEHHYGASYRNIHNTSDIILFYT